ncbi:MAG: aldo/keto reductase, partial [Chloroflexi bacterium]|nr:aldo/keto reductase [Chloroflexota bacterium]
PQYAADVEELLKVCRERNVAVQTIKGITRSPWHAKPHTANTWYEPLTDQADLDKAVHWILGNPIAFLNTAAEISLLPKVLDAAARFTARPSDEEMQKLLHEQAMEPLFA